jgi:serine/threonine-protein kinase HipA
VSWSGFAFAYLAGMSEAVPAGRLELVEDATRLVRSTFAYGRKYLQRPEAIPVDPRSLPLDSEPGPREYEPRNGLEMFGAIRDAAPDFWGRRVIEAKLKAPPDSLPESRYLLEAGTHRFGALDFRGELTDGEHDGALPPVTDLHYLVDAADRIQEGRSVPKRLAMLFDAASLGGARPKALVVREGRHYLAKFPAKSDAWNVPAIERACLELARRCGLNVPETGLVRLADGREVMLIERFDRAALGDGRVERRHAVSALTMLGKIEQESAASGYAEIAQAIRTHGVGAKVRADQRELYARVAFSILVSNDDDHLRNHAFVWDPSGRGWRLSPLYDVVPHPQVARERLLHLSVGPRGRSATLDNLLDAHADFGLLVTEAASIIDRVARCVRQWRHAFEQAGVSAAECDKVASAFRRPRDVGLDAVEAHLRPGQRM